MAYVFYSVQSCQCCGCFCCADADLPVPLLINAVLTLIVLAAKRKTVCNLLHKMLMGTGIVKVVFSQELMDLAIQWMTFLFSASALIVLACKKSASFFVGEDMTRLEVTATMKGDILAKMIYTSRAVIIIASCRCYCCCLFVYSFVCLLSVS